MKKQLIHVWHFPNGTSGSIVKLGTVMREVRNRRLYIPHKSGCESARMGWEDVQLVTICDLDLIVTEQDHSFGDHKVGDLVVTLAMDDKIPHDLRRVKA